MSYSNEIFLYKNLDQGDFTVFDLLESIKDTPWEVTYSLLDKGNAFDWVQLGVNERERFFEIIRYKTQAKELIGLSLVNKNENRLIHVHVYSDSLLLDVEIRKGENEEDWFSWYHKNFVLKIPTLNIQFSSIEWRTGYENKVIKLIKFR